MKQIALALPILLLLSGCSVFGIATKAQVEEQELAAKAQHEQLRQENRAQHEQLVKIDALLVQSAAALQELRSALGDLDARAENQRQEIWSQTGTLQLRMASIEGRIGEAAAASDSIREGLVETRLEAQIASARALEVRDDLDGVADQAGAAEARSEALLRAWLERLHAERERLHRQLTALEASLERWETGLASKRPGRERPSPSTETDVDPASFAPRR